MFIVVPFINSTRLAIVAEADLRCGDFLSEKSCRNKLVVSTSFWYRLLNVSSVLTTKKDSDKFFWVVNVLMRCGYADGSWEYKVFDFVLYVSELFLFFVFVLDPNFCGTNFFTFQDTVWLVEKF